jgi:hypothetical protein
MTIIEDSGGPDRRPNAARVIAGALAVGTPVAVDGTLSELVVIDSTHQRIHRGEFFSGGAFDAALGNGANLDLLIQTGAIAPHMQIAGQVGQTMLAQLYEDTTFSVAGTAAGFINRNRVSTKTSGVTLTTGPTITDLGTPLFTGFAPGGVGNRPEGGGLSTFAEYLLKPNSVYLARLANTVVAAANLAQIELNWYEPGAA